MNTAAKIDTILANPLIAVAAERVASAEAHLAELREATRQAQLAADNIGRRMASLDAERAAIARRRRDGDARPGDGGELEVIRMDREGLEQLHQEAGTALAEAQAKQREAARALEAEAKALRDAEDHVEVDALKRHADALSSTLGETLVALAAAGQRIGPMNLRWTPPAELMNRLRRAEVAGRPLP